MTDLHTTESDQQDEIDLGKLIKDLWSGKLVILVCMAIFAALSYSYVLLATKVYRAQASIQIRDESGGGLTSEIGGLAALAGFSVGGQSQNKDFAVVALKSRAVIQRMIEEENLLPALYSDSWDPESKRWKIPDAPTPWKAYELFTNSILKISEEKKTGILTVAIEWNDPVLAAKWVEALIVRVNTFVNDSTIREAEQNLKFLDQQIKDTQVVELKNTIFSMMEGEIKRLMLARNLETAPLRVIDPALVPERHVRPKRSMILILGTLAGGLLGGVAVLVRTAMGRKPREI